ncbi:hypothetical protein SAMN04244572_01939 [Azotobacter beijerinckii]|uniref:Uncharacterized protein n=1 Tax=Azotobacter beijerinckii TaxID=170623 RepID=A0A1H6U411_9GAMM|nr:hypothetical protein [Azotobacter beijerinckii]SEI87021.1 hypothetical protein SAMN04244572_01939 [Azotobacter beijerinckii]
MDHFQLPRRTAAEHSTCLRDLFLEALHAVGYFDHIAAGASEAHARSAMPAAAVGGLRLLTDTAPTLNPETDGGIYLPAGHDAAKSNRLSDAVLSHSVLAGLGARLIVVPAAPPPTMPEAPAGALYARVSRYDVVKPAAFSLLADGDSVADSALPIARASIDLSEMPTYSFRVAMSRAQQREFGLGFLSAELEQAIALGVARTADAVLVKALEAATLPAFSLGAAAAAGCAFSDLRAVVGSAGAGAAANLGGLYVLGIAAEMVQDATQTLVGTWQRAAIAIHEDIRLICDRRSVEGDMALTAHFNAQALIPDLGYFFQVAP